jgi:pimeloyl-ACP methyl ester carboxylesterase
MCKVPPAVASAVLLDQTLVDHRESLSELKVDTLVCFGRDAKLLSVAAGEDVAARIPGARLQVFEDSSHCPFLEEPAAFNAAVSAFASRKRTANA